MSGGGKSAEVEADLIRHAIDGRFLSTIDVFYREMTFEELSERAEDLHDKYNWFIYRGDYIRVSNEDAARQRQIEIRQCAFE